MHKAVPSPIRLSQAHSRLELLPDQAFQGKIIVGKSQEKGAGLNFTVTRKEGRLRFIWVPHPLGHFMLPCQLLPADVGSLSCLHGRL